MPDHIHFMRLALDEARQALDNNEFPVGCVLVCHEEIVAKGRRQNTRQANRNELDHAEIVALRDLVTCRPEIDPSHITAYCTMEPCLMCFASILIHGIGRIVFGASDSHGGAGPVQSHLPPYFEKRLAETQWSGPIMPAECDPLYERLLVMLRETQRGLV